MKRFLILLGLLHAGLVLKSQETISALEHFIDDDPGYGAATSVSITSGTSISESLQINTSSLSIGFHTLFIRVQNSAGAWGIPESRLVYVDPSGTGIVNIQSLEYFIDDDPGYGSGTAFTAFTAAQAISQMESVATSSLSVGFHTLYVRAQAEGGSWGIPEPRLIYVDPSGTGIVNIQSLEYFIDDDPGYGSGTAFTAFTAAQAISQVESVATSSLSEGFHTLYVRAQAEGGSWGIPEPRLIYVDPSGTGIVNIQSLEYFIDDDPGYGNGTAFTAFTAAQAISQMESVNTSALSVGFHTLFVRAQAEGGSWGIPESRLIYVDPSGTGTVNIDQLEYFIDDDPGYGNGTGFTAFSAAQVISEMETVSTSSLSTGFHTLFLRARAEGGSWGIPESRLIYVDPSGIGMVNIESLEYFFDDDPGYGNGTAFTAFTAEEVVSQMESLPTSTLSLGFHRLFIRAKAEGGSWGIPESRLVYVDQSGPGPAIVDKLEYFIGDDPGFGNGTDIPVTSGISIDEMFTVLSSSLVVGQNQITIRARDENGRWGIGETRTFTNYAPSRELDSVSLIAIYDETAGASWTNNANWLSTDIDNWFGVTVSGDRVTELDLNNNNLVGVLPEAFGFLEEAISYDLSSNQLTDSVPSSIDLLINLGQLTLDDNILSDFPNVTLASLNTLNLDSNAFEFGALEPYASVSSFTYDNQATLSTDLDTLVNVGDTFDHTFDVSGSNNVYQWTLNGSAISGATTNNLNLSINPVDTGAYVLEVTNTELPDLALQSGVLNYRIPILQADSMLLVELYNQTDGTNWTDNTGWLSDNLSNWMGVTLVSDRVSQVDLSSNALQGEAPGDLLYLEELTQMNLSGNSLTAIPDLSSIAGLTNFDVSSNLLEFDDLEPNASISGLVYTPQAELTSDRDTLHKVDEALTFSIVTGGSNAYQWNKDNTAITGETNASLTFATPNFDDEGTYQLDVTNSSLPDLTLSTGDINLSIDAIERDSTALVAFYNALGGASWTNNSNWLTGNLGTWNGVTLGGHKVSQIELPSNNLNGDVPGELSEVDQLEVIDLSGNGLTGLPNLSPLALATTINVSGNALEFDDLESNSSLESVMNYSPQAVLSSDIDTLVALGSNMSLQLMTAGANNSYQWQKDNTNIDGETNDAIALNPIAFDDAGEYVLQVNNTSFPDLTLASGLFRVKVSSISRDSTALVNLYNALNGTNWPKQDNWLSGTLDTWQGVVIGEDKVVGLNLSDNNLSGEVPSDLLDIDQIDSLDLSGNALTGLPVLTSLSLATKINLSENQLDFGDLEGNESIETLLTYAPQANLTEDSELLVEIGEQAVFTVNEESAGASYQWQKDDVDLDGENGLSLTIDDTQIEAEGFYVLGASHPDFPDLSLSSGKFQLKVSSLQRDRIALLNIYEATGGADWVSDANLWPGQDISTWVGIRIANNRVVEIDLENEGMIGDLPSDINDIRNLELVNLSNNKLTGIPTIQGLDQLTSFNVSVNFLDFGDLEPNTEVTGITYTPQQPFGSTESILSPKSTNVLLDRSVSGSANVYAWTVNGPVASGVIEDATNGTLTVTDIDYNNMGTYQVAITNENVSGLTLESQPFDVLATVDISLLPLYRDIDDELTILDEGDAQLHRVTDLGGFDSLSTVALAGDAIIFDEVVLDNYLISVNTDTLLIRQKDTRTDSVRVLPSYYRSTFLWEEADTIFLRDILEDTIFLQQRPRVALDGDGEVGLLVESDFLENRGKEAQRIEARRKVKRAGCSLRRRRRASGGRPENEGEFELVAYKETDDNGRVTFENLPPDTYRLNIEYPGIPMDPNTFIEFEVGANGMEDNVLELEATITEEGIAVELVEELGFLRNYFKDLSIYPNPVTNELNISYEKLMSKHVSVQLLNLQGQLMLERKVQQGLEQRMELDMSDFDTGIYLLRFIDRSYKIPSIVTYRVMKQ
ncbi:MAG: T9SS type A sorting domain-containing protein [Cytophagales bacterium]|nr:T9SS type A sorting domain-containing protein [Cytophagales bacterium]